MAAPIMTSAGVGQKTTGVRHWVLVFSLALAMISYIGRVRITQAAPPISRDLGLTKVQTGYSFTAFAIAYAIFAGAFLGRFLDPVTPLDEQCRG
jgi:MFS family permease